MIAWQNPGRPLILASQSPRRKQILSQMGLTFETTSPGDIDEASFIDKNDLHSSLERLALAKAQSVARTRGDALVLGADTVVVTGDRILGKPADRKDAALMLRTLSGVSHKVITAIALLCADESFSTTSTAVTDVFFRTLSAGEIDEYLSHDEYRDKAGAYAIQGRAMVFISRIAGCYYNVVGLPVAETIHAFEAFALRGSPQ